MVPQRVLRTGHDAVQAEEVAEVPYVAADSLDFEDLLVC
jgi:hypothetical protein